MSSLTIILALFGFSWILAGVALILHRLYPRTGLTPMVMYLGAITAVMQLQGLRALEIPLGNYRLNLDAAGLLPVLLFGILIVYIINGSVRGRSAALGILLISGLEIFFQAVLNAAPGISEIEINYNRYSLRIILTSTMSLAIAIIVLFLAYQSLSNLRHRYPSRLASGLALLLALFVDAVIFSALAFWGSDEWLMIFLSQIAEKLVAGLALWPLLAFYLYRVAPRLPDSAATSERPILDIFTTNLQLESRARYHYNLLHTLSRINRLIMHASGANSLLQQACDVLLELRPYNLVWISGLGPDFRQLQFSTQAKISRKQFEKLALHSQVIAGHATKSQTQAWVINDIAAQKDMDISWREMMLATGCQAAASFPMRYLDRNLGSLNVGLNHPNSFTELEIDLLQDLADNLAYALISLEARSQQTLLQKTAETMRDGLLILNIQGEIIYANRVIAEFAAASQNELLGKQVATLLPPHQADMIPAASDTLFKNGVLVSDIEYQPKADRQPLIVSINASLGRNALGEPDHIIVNIRNVTSQRKYEHQLLTLQRLTTDLVQIHDPQILSNMILKISEDVLNAEASGIYLIDPKNQKVIETITSNLPRDYSQRIARDYSGLPGETTLKTLQPVYVNDTLNDSTYQERIHFMADFGIRALIILPVLVHEKLLGALTVYFQQPHTFSPNDVQIGQTLAQTLAMVYQNAQLYQAEHKHRELAEALVKAAASINSSLRLEEVLDQILEQVMRVIPCKAANIAMIEGEFCFIHSHRGYETFSDDSNFLKDLRIPLHTPNYAYMITEGEPCLVGDTTQDQNWKILPGAEWVKGYAGTPLKVDQQVVGFLNIDSDVAEFFTNETVNQLRSFADYASTAIKNARAYENSRSHAEEMTALVTAASAVSKSLDVMQVLQIIAEQMANVLHVKACAISDYDINRNQVSLLLEFAPEGLDVGEEWYQPYNLEEYPLTRQVLENNQPLQLRLIDPDLEKNERRFMEEADIDSLLMLPLVSQDRTIGLVELIDDQKDRYFSEREISLGLSLASHAASAIENASLYRRLQEYASELEKRVDRRTHQLQAATEYIEGILASVPDAIFVLGEHQEVVRANQAGEKLLYQAKETGLDLFNPQLLKILETGGGPNVQSILEVQGKAYQALSSPLNSAEGQTSGQIIVFRDVTHFRELDQMKTQFVSDVSHELRTPLTNLTLYLGLLTTVQDPKKQNDYILTLQRETERLTHLIEELLTISRLEAGRIQFHIRPTDINQLVKDMVCDRVILAAQKEIMLDFTPREGIPLTSADKNMLTQALSNLLTNAINYTQPLGNINIYTAHPKPDWCTIQISDTGVGIPPEEIEHIFDRFYRGSASQLTGAEGTGLGLAISEEIIHRMGGRISLESIPGEGSTFTIWLKIATDHVL